MAFITRCPHCATTFRVTPLHLQAHGGDVRCGRCAQVFNAYSTLSTIQEPGTADLAKGKAEETTEEKTKDRPTDQSPALEVSGHAGPPPAPGDEVTRTEAHARSVTEETATPEAEITEALIPDATMPEVGGPAAAKTDILLQEQPVSEPAAAEQVSTGSVTDTASAAEKPHVPESSESEGQEPKTQEPEAQEPGARELGADESGIGANETHATGPYAAQAHAKEEPAEEMHEREMRGEQETRREVGHEAAPENYAFDAVPPRDISPAWSFASLLLLILFTGQTIYFYRAELAALVPAAKPYLEQYCELLQCSISVPRHPRLLNIESSDMHADPRHPGVITLNATVRNHGSSPQAFPLFELTFIDNQNRPLASRIFKPDAYLGEEANKVETVSPGSEFNVKLHLDTGNLNAAGYRLSLLYPNP
ncbi:DUF3426 domain-containing protein [Nitrosovibrio tenuis]|uniref:MJ0042 family finger-like domain-containing protein n=1 Tax=Nitrosovibrio tenuis TaxID=1233 RepID=A0A1H7LL39_9PROT|nr:DUF3426 domain-containing protein [Nitrosovibrio tenuis]SEK99660.1 MJ0042 family finger-like domain-containing protein [Nitrosovibrio tenuis]